MYASHLFRLSVVALVVFLNAWRADEAPKTRSLFDGKTLDGWKKTDFSGAGKVIVENGAIVMKAGESMTGITCSRKDLPTSDYELIYEAQRLEGGDFFAAATFPVGKNFITLVNGGWGGTVTGLSSLGGADASENETGHFYKYESKKWYTFRVRVTDEIIRCWIDKDKVVDISHQDRHVGTRIETRDNQPLGFATWETTGVLRRVDVRSLTPEEIKETNKDAK